MTIERIWNTIKTTLFYYSDLIPSPHLCYYIVCTSGSACVSSRRRRARFCFLSSFVLTDFFPSTYFIRYRTKKLKRFIQGLVFKGILKGQESKSWDFSEGPRRFRGPQKSEKFHFSKRTNKSVDHKFKFFAINWPQISI